MLSALSGLPVLCSGSRCHLGVRQGRWGCDGVINLADIRPLSPSTLRRERLYGPEVQRAGNVICTMPTHACVSVSTMALRISPGRHLKAHLPGTPSCAGPGSRTTSWGIVLHLHTQRRIEPACWNSSWNMGSSVGRPGGDRGRAEGPKTSRAAVRLRPPHQPETAPVGTLAACSQNQQQTRDPQGALVADSALSLQRRAQMHCDISQQHLHGLGVWFKP